MVLGFYFEAYQRSDSMSISISKQKKKKEEERKNILINFPQRIFTSLQQFYTGYISSLASFNSVTILQYRNIILSTIRTFPS